MSDYSFSFCDKNRVYNPAWMAPEGLVFSFNWVLKLIRFFNKILIFRLKKKAK